MNKYYSETALSAERIAVGARLMPLVKSPTRVGVVLFCAAIRNFHRLHYDLPYTQAQNIRDVIVPGFLMGNWCVEAVTRSLMPGAEIRRLKFKNTRMAFVEDSFRIEGTVVAYDAGAEGGPLARCDLTVTDSAGEVVTTGTVDVTW